MVARAACKVAFGIDLPVSDFLGAVEGELASEVGAGLIAQTVGLVDLEDTISSTTETAGHRISTAIARGMVGDAFESLKSFIEKQRADHAGSRFIEHTDHMRLCDDAEGARVWVSSRNVAKWNSRLEKRDPTSPYVRGGAVPFGTRAGIEVSLPTASAIPISSDNRLGRERAVDPGALRQSDIIGGGLFANCKEAPAGTIGGGGRW